MKEDTDVSRPQAHLPLRASNGCTSPLLYAEHQVGVLVEQHSVAVIHHGHQAPATLVAASPWPVAKLECVGHGSGWLLSARLGLYDGSDAVVLVTEA